MEESPKTVKAPTWKEQGGFPYRYLVAWMAFWGMVFNYVLRININLAIVAMVQPGNTTGQNESSECDFEDEYLSDADKGYDGPFDWSESQQGLVLASFFWGYIWTQVPGGRLAEVVGARRVFGGALLGHCLLTLLEPAASYWSINALMVVRVLMGLITGVTFPATHALLTSWAPPQERSFMSAIVYAGSQAGTVIGYPLTGALINGLGWEWVFYVEGLLGLVWVVLWFVLVSDTPEEAKWMSQVEKDYILVTTAETKFKKSPPIPWKSIVTSLPMWAILIADIGNNWGFYTLLTDLPLYMKEMLKQDLSSNAWLSGGPYIGMWVSSILIGYLGDKAIKRNLISVGAFRKLATGFAHYGSGFSLLFVTFVECDRTATIVFLYLAVFTNGGIYSGFMINHMDIAPNYAGTLFGITNGAAAIPGFLAPMTVGYLTDDNQTLAQWRKVFYIAFAIYVIDATFYIIFSSGEEQEWNRLANSDDTEGDNAEKVNAGTAPEKYHSNILQETKGLGLPQEKAEKDKQETGKTNEGFKED